MPAYGWRGGDYTAIDKAWLERFTDIPIL